MRCELRRDYRFEAARHLPHIGPDHPCARTHGHSFRVRVKVEGEVDPQQGWVMDFSTIDAAVMPAVQELDHRLLNDVSGLENPTSEHIAAWIWQRVAPALPGLSSVRISETDSSSVTYRGS